MYGCIIHANSLITPKERKLTDIALGRIKDAEVSTCTFISVSSLDLFDATGVSDFLPQICVTPRLFKKLPPIKI